ncbi:hypothetical protein [Vibrio profundum]
MAIAMQPRGWIRDALWAHQSHKQKQTPVSRYVAEITQHKDDE